MHEFGAFDGKPKRAVEKKYVDRDQQINIQFTLAKNYRENVFASIERSNRPKAPLSMVEQMKLDMKRASQAISDSQEDQPKKVQKRKKIEKIELTDEQK